MKPEEIKLSDWARILFGEVPPSFFIELIIRTLFVFLLLIISMRLLGRRMAAQLSRMEMVALFSLAAAIGVPLQAPDRGLLPALVIAVIVVVVGRVLTSLMFNNQRLEARISDRLTILVKDGVMDIKKIKGTRLTVELVLATLRSQSVRHLGEVKRLYIEANGSFSMVKQEQPSPGLAVIPFNDKAFLDEQKQTSEQVCKTCGQKQKQQQNANRETCITCGNRDWVPAII